MSDEEKQAFYNVFKVLDNKFTSGNNVPVERNVVLAQEWQIIRKALVNLAKPNEDRDYEFMKNLQASLETCKLGHKFVKLTGHPMNREGRPGCPNCMVLNLGL